MSKKPTGEPVGRPPTHGVRGLRRVEVKAWPLQLRRAHERRVAEIGALPHIDMRRHRGAVAQCVRYEMLLAVAYGWIMEHGVFDEAGAPAPLMALITKLENSQNRFYQMLQLTPAADARVQSKGPVTWEAALAEHEEVAS